MNLAATLTVNALYRILNMVVMLVIVVLVSKLAGVSGYGILLTHGSKCYGFNLVFLLLALTPGLHLYIRPIPPCSRVKLQRFFSPSFLFKWGYSV